MGSKVTNNAFDTANNLEIAKVTARAADVLTIERGEENTAPERIPLVTALSSA